MSFIFSKEKIITFIVSLALFMDAVDATIINTAIPAMSHSLSVHPVDLKIALISYLLSLAIFIPISGWVADKFGIKRVFIAALAVFTLSSLWCGHVQSLYELVMARSVQGLGGSLMLPLACLIILRTFPRHEMVTAMNQVIMVVSIGLMIGPFVGGFITDHFSWHWIFWVNIPVGFFAIAAAYHWLEDTNTRISKPFDGLGFILFGGGLAALTFALSYLSETTASQRSAWMILLAAICMLVLYFLHSRGRAHPLIRLELFRNRTFQVAIFGNLLARLSFGGIPFLLPLLLQVGLDYSAQLSGTLLIPIAFGIIISKYSSLRIMRFFGYKRLLILNTILVALSIWTFRIINNDTPIYVISILTFLFGCFISLQYISMNSLVYAEVTAEEHSAATSILSTIQQLAQSFGVAASALLLRFYGSATAQHFPLTINVFHQTFFALGLLTLCSIGIFLRLKYDDGQQMLSI